jgi:putative ABC transport system permease protein
MKDYFVLASKNLRKRGIRSWLTLLGILIGIAAVVSLISLGNALKDTVNSQFNIGSVETISVQAGGITGLGPPGTGVSNPITERDAEAIERLSSVDSATFYLIRTLAIEFNDIAVFRTMQSVPDGEKLRVNYEDLELSASHGRLLQSGERNNIMIGSDFFENSKNIFGKALKVGDRLIIKEREFRIIGVVGKKGSFIIDGGIFMNKDSLKELSEAGETVDLIDVKPKDSVDRTKADIEKLMRDRRNVKLGEEDFEVSTAEQSLASINQIIGGIQAFIVIIASISIIVGAIGIANTMATSVIERRKEIGTMKAIGARNENIFYQFFVEAGLLGLVGGIIGILLGTGIAYLGTFGLNSFLGTETKPNISLFLIGFSLLGSFLIGAVSGIVPAMNAAKQNPVEAIRG